MAKAICGAGVFLLLFAPFAAAQDLGDDELQVALNSYFDNFNVRIVYPSISFTKKYSDSAAVNLRYLVDVISAASMRSHFEVDGVTSATEKEDGGGDSTPDEVRHEFGLGFTDLLGGGLIRGGTLALNVLYSVEHDYASFTAAGTFTYLLARKNTTLQLGYIRSRDKVFPQIRTWRKNKDVVTFSFSATQILGPRLISQLIFSYNQARGYLSDAYQVVQIIEGDQVVNYEPVHPSLRIRRAVGVRANYKYSRQAAFNFGLRYYWDNWEVNSLTASVVYRWHLNPLLTAGLGLRTYVQSRAYFFKPEYAEPEPYMSVDTKLDAGYSTDLQLMLTLNGGYLRNIPLLADEKTQLNLRINIYRRHTSTPDWHSRYRDLLAYLFSFSVRYRF